MVKVSWNCIRLLPSVSATEEGAFMPYGTLQGLKRSSTSMQAAERLEAYTGLYPMLLP